MTLKTQALNQPEPEKTITPSRSERLQRLRELNRHHFKSKVWSYFPTPPVLINTLLQHADVQDGMSILEPSAGQGAIVRRIQELWDCIIRCVEQNSDFTEILRLYGFNVVSNDFAMLRPKPVFDRVIANPPFDRQMTHLPLMHHWLKPGGKLVSIANACFLEENKQRYRSAQYKNHTGKGRLYHQFFHWLDAVNAQVIPLPQGSFATASRQTNVNTVLITATK